MRQSKMRMKLMRKVNRDRAAMRLYYRALARRGQAPKCPTFSPWGTYPKTEKRA